jgi:hypothetical protein
MQLQIFAWCKQVQYGNEHRLAVFPHGYCNHFCMSCLPFMPAYESEDAYVHFRFALLLPWHGDDVNGNASLSRAWQVALAISNYPFAAAGGSKLRASHFSRSSSVISDN